MRRGNPPWRSAGRQHRFQVTTHAGGMVDSATYDATAPARLAETLY